MIKAAVRLNSLHNAPKFSETRSDVTHITLSFSCPGGIEGEKTVREPTSQNTGLVIKDRVAEATAGRCEQL